LISTIINLGCDIDYPLSAKSDAIWTKKGFSKKFSANRMVIAAITQVWSRLTKQRSQFQ